MGKFLTKESADAMFEELLSSAIPIGWAISKQCGAKEDRFIVIELPAQGVGDVRTSLSEDDAIGLAWKLLGMANPRAPLILSELLMNYIAQSDDTAPTPPPPA